MMAYRERDGCQGRRDPELLPVADPGDFVLDGYEPAVDDFGNQYLARKDRDDICHHCGQKMVVVYIGGGAHLANEHREEPDGPIPIDPPEDVHVTPSLGEHVVSMHCWCHPQITYTHWVNGGRVWVHRSPA